MATDPRNNFRTLYYEHLGLRKTDQDQLKVLEQILQEDPIDVEKLKCFTLQYSLPAIMRPHIWKILLDILPLHKESVEFIMKHRRGQFDDLKQALTVMKMIPVSPQNDPEYKPYKTIVSMFLVENGMLSVLHKDVLKKDAHKVWVLESFSKVVCEIISDECDAFWISKRLFQERKNFFSLFMKLPKYVKYYLQLEDQRLFEHLCELQLFKVLPYDKCFQTYFSTVFMVESHEYLGRIWDKIVAGSCNILVFVFVAILLTFSIRLKEVRSSKAALKLVSHVSEDSGYAVIDKTMELWEQHCASLDNELSCN